MKELKNETDYLIVQDYNIGDLTIIKVPSDKYSEVSTDNLLKSLGFDTSCTNYMWNNCIPNIRFCELKDDRLILKENVKVEDF